MNALRDGIRRVNDAPAILFGVWLGQQLFDTLWLGRLAIGLFLCGGIIDRYARDRPTRSYGFFGACGVFFFRFLRIAVPLGIPYVLLLRAAADLPAGIPSNAIVPATLALTSLFEYTAACSVIEDRHSMIGSIAAAVRFVIGNAGGVLTIFLAELILGWIPGAVLRTSATSPSAEVWSSVAAFAGVWIALAGLAFKVSLYQSRLAHAGYIARAQPAWPESPAAEAIRNSPR